MKKLFFSLIVFASFLLCLKVSKANTPPDSELSVGPKINAVLNRNGTSSPIPLYQIPVLKTGDTIELQLKNDYLLPGGKTVYFAVALFVMGDYINSEEVVSKPFKDNLPVSFQVMRNESFPVFVFFPENFPQNPTQAMLDKRAAEVSKRIVDRFGTKTQEIRDLALNSKKIEAQSARLKSVKEFLEGFRKTVEPQADEDEKTKNETTSRIRRLANTFNISLSAEQYQSLKTGSSVERINTALGLVENTQSFAFSAAALGAATSEELRKLAKSRGISDEMYSEYILLIYNGVQLVYKIFKAWQTQYRYVPTTVTETNEDTGYTLGYSPVQTKKNEIKVYMFTPLPSNPPTKPKLNISVEPASSCIDSRTVVFTPTGGNVGELFKDVYLRDWKLEIADKPETVLLALDPDSRKINAQISDEYYSSLQDENSVNATISVMWGSEKITSNAVRLPVRLTSDLNGATVSQTQLINGSRQVLNLTGNSTSCISKITYVRNGNAVTTAVLEPAQQNGRKATLDLTEVDAGSGMINFYGFGNPEAMTGKTLRIISPQPVIGRITLRGGQTNATLEGEYLQNITSVQVGPFTFYPVSLDESERNLRKLEIRTDDPDADFTAGNSRDVKINMNFYSPQFKTITIQPPTVAAQPQ